MRDYGSDPQIWDGAPDCKHKWISERTSRPNSSGGHNDYLKAKGKENYSEYADYKDRATYSNFCQKCGAWKGELGLEPTFELYIKHLCDIFDEVKRVLKPSGTCWVNLGDSYGGTGAGQEKSPQSQGKQTDGQFIEQAEARVLKNKATKGKYDKCLMQIPSRFALEMTNRNWILRNEIIWHKPNCMPSSIKDRFTVDFEKLFFFVKNKKYYFEQQFEPTAESSMERYKYGLNQTDCKEKAVNVQNLSSKDFKDRFFNENGRNKRCVWEICPQPFSEAHFACYPEELCETPIKAGCPKDGIVCDIFHGSGTTGKVAQKLGRKYIGIDIKKEYLDMSLKTRLKDRYFNL